MKNIFGFEGQKEEKATMHGAPFLLRTVTPEEEKAHQQNDEKIQHAEKKMEMPLVLRIVHLVAYFVAVICFVGFLRAGVPLKVAYQNAPYIFYAGGIALLVAVGLQIYAHFRKKKYLASDEHRALVSTLESQCQQELASLGIPEKHIDVDIMGEYYHIAHNGKKKSFYPAPYVTTSVYAWVDDTYLYMADNLSIYAFSLDEMGPIQYVKKRTTTLGWNKEIPPNSEAYKPYKLGVDTLGGIVMQGYYSLPIKSATFGDFEILFPSFEEKSATALAAFGRYGK